MTMTSPRRHAAGPRASSLGPYVQSISSLGRISAAEEVQLARKWREEKCEQSRERLITANLRLVVAHAKRYAGKGVPTDELVAEGNLGLIRAVDHFDPGAGCRFSTYAAYWIRNSIGQAFARASTQVPLSRKERALVADLTRAEQTLDRRDGQKAEDDKIAEVLEWTVDKVRSVRTMRDHRARTDVISQAGGPRGSFDAESLPDRESTIDLASAEGEQIPQLLAGLPKLERRAIELSFGLDSGQARSTRAVASILGQPPHRTKRILQAALASLVRQSRRSYPINSPVSAGTSIGGRLSVA